MSSEAAYFPDAIARSDKDQRDTGKLALQDDSSNLATLTTATDEKLLSEVGLGSKSALTQLFRRYRRTVCNVASRILRDPSEAEDLCQEVFLFLFENSKFFDASKGTAASWIIQIAYHRAMNRRKYLSIRQHYTAQEFNEQIVAERQELFINEIDARALLNRLRRELSREQQQTLELYFFEGYSLREIAEKTSQTLGCIRHHYYRGLERLRASVFTQKDA
jgi:RNA polymerase sigma-70 factor (ECF subfamily)